MTPGRGRRTQAAVSTAPDARTATDLMPPTARKEVTDR